MYEDKCYECTGYGDDYYLDDNGEWVSEHEKINVYLQITKITKHVSSFDFEDDFEERSIKPCETYL